MTKYTKSTSEDFSLLFNRERSQVLVYEFKTDLRTLPFSFLVGNFDLETLRVCPRCSLFSRVSFFSFGLFFSLEKSTETLVVLFFKILGTLKFNTTDVCLRNYYFTEKHTRFILFRTRSGKNSHPYIGFFYVRNKRSQTVR